MKFRELKAGECFRFARGDRRVHKKDSARAYMESSVGPRAKVSSTTRGVQRVLCPTTHVRHVVEMGGVRKSSYLAGEKPRDATLLRPPTR